ncbi:MAG TPA: neutral zinc metallopeptidase [Burkholderiaceae bacterium]|nr:neutral zinc metallopeptidase [Burkholderiaceae bacterium]
MKWDGNRESDNVEDRRGSGFGGRSIGIGTIVVALVASYFLGIDPATVLSLLSGGGPAQVQQAEPPAAPARDQMTRFVSTVLADTEDTWSELFRASGVSYVRPKLVLFSGRTATACGTGESASGPFYCPDDQKIYIDLDFYRLMQQRFGVSGDFAQAYVIAHEVGHHVQNLMGTMQTVDRRRQRASAAETNALSVRLELQADCYAGVWAFHANQARSILEAGDVEKALNAATAIGDDALQKQAQGYAVPDSFTHGTSAQRVRWFKRGIDSGQIAACDTFQVGQL